MKSPATLLSSAATYSNNSRDFRRRFILTTTMRADLLLANGAIHTCAGINPANYLAVTNGHVAGAGRGSGKSWVGRNTEVIDLRGKSITPGLIDGHIHFLDYAFNLDGVQLVQCKDRNDVLNTLRERARRLDPGEWVFGRGWRATQMGGLPHRKMLDEIFPRNPVVLHSHDEHSRWLNTKALEACGITKATPVDGGFVGADPDGSANGILGENAVALLRPHLPVPDAETRRRALLRAQNEMHRLGVVGIHSMDANKAFSDLQDLNSQQKLKLRVFHSIPVRQLEQAVEIGMKTGMGDGFFRFGPVKIFSDGALGSKSAWMLEPFLESDQTGIEILSEGELTEKIRIALSNGIAVAVHAIGDRANRQALNAYEKNAHLLTLPHAASRIEHAQLLHPQDVPRFAKIGVVASMQPYHAISDQPLAIRFWGSRAQYSYAWQSLLAGGATLLFGSDSPVEDPDPLQGLRAAVQRWNWEDRSQTISPHDALLAYTRIAAYASGELSYRGTLEPGKLADLTVFSEDPLKSGFQDVRVVGTAVQGEFVYRDF